MITANRLAPLLLGAIAAAALLLSGLAHGRDLTIAAASDLKYALDEIVAQFREDHPQAEIQVIYGSSGRFRAQIAHGAPFDLYFSADIAYPRALHAAGFAASEVIPYAYGRLVVWSVRHPPTALELSRLDQPEIRRIALANPRHAPYGQRAREALEHAGIWSRIQPKLAFAENIAHAAQFVESGAADAGLIALSLALHPRMQELGGYWLIPADWHEPLEQGFIITRRAAQNPLAHAFAEYMVGEHAGDVMRRYGFVLPND
jgi:molybdate transport system substrate-binding protein